MLPRLTLGQYLPGDSPIHRLDARTKILVTLAYMAALLFARGPLALGACAAFTAGWLATARLPPAALWRGNRGIIVLVLLTVVLDVLLGPPTTAAAASQSGWHVGPFLVTQTGVATGLAAGLRLGLLVAQSTLVTATTAPLDLVAGTETLLGPFRRVGVPAHDLALMTGLALRFIPTLAEEAQRIALAQAARGADLQSPGRARLRAIVAMLVPLLLSVLRRAEQLALAMEARGYRGAEGRSRWRQPRLGRLDAVAGAAGVALVLAVTLASLMRHPGL